MLIRRKTGHLLVWSMTTLAGLALNALLSSVYCNVCRRAPPRTIRDANISCFVIYIDETRRHMYVDTAPSTLTSNESLKVVHI